MLTGPFILLSALRNPSFLIIIGFPIKPRCKHVYNRYNNFSKRFLRLYIVTLGDTRKVSYRHKAVIVYLYFSLLGCSILTILQRKLEQNNFISIKILIK